MSSPDIASTSTSNTSPLQVAVVGLGGMGTFHARLLHDIGGAEVVVIADPFHPDITSLADELGAEVVDDPADVAADRRVDAVVIASPDETHAELVLAAIAANKPVLCEKPLATSMADATRVVKAESDLGRRLLQLGFMREYDEAHKQLVEATAELGPVHHIRCLHRNPPSPPRPLEVIVGQSIVHDIHSVRFITGAEITKVTTSLTHTATGDIRHTVVLAGLSSGGHATLEFDNDGFAYEVGVELTAEHGGASLGPQVRANVDIDGFRKVNIGADWFARFAQAYRSEVAAWVTAARAGTATGPTSHDGLVAQNVVEAIVKSANTGVSVEVGVVPEWTL